MSLTSDLRQVRISEGVRNKILILDVERLPGITEQYWWGRGDLKNRYVQYETVTRMPRTTIVCAKWYDQPEVIQLAEWDKGGRKRFLRRVHNLLSQADIVVGHYIDEADVPWLKGDLHLEAGLPPLPPFKTVDTLKVLRREFKSGAPFKGLDAFCQIVGLPAKTDRYDRGAMERAVTGKSAADRERLVSYCAGDVVATQGLYDFLRPHIKNHPALFVDGEDKLTVCNRCGSETVLIPRRYVANVLTYTMRRCTSCGAHSRLSIEPERMSVVRGV
ncbi:DnaQ-like DNA polymerase III subunit [Mycobacterium phage Chuckly]|uniref:DnaQ-like DNA polymerase III subunit n=1 Tax=Mycobacterium phage Chuckly TaxID=2656569 RepID=A0A649VD85_9CAUD|nr:DNA polymerase exonuclease subunit [Mycobacterium phage Bipolar]YP_009955443.1 DNA polymerase exonuclease subunit [Mycobacterium phage Chuckly]AIT13070.1 DnaQ-like DNA polymerase III subunit [Mycobacterium phage Bipolar]QGJ90276.1 DnaQ-like DNA polymerase III subunit [Mycobacterium phage Chuckly]